MMSLGESGVLLGKALAPTGQSSQYTEAIIPAFWLEQQAKAFVPVFWLGGCGLVAYISGVLVLSKVKQMTDSRQRQVTQREAHHDA
jgi:hypothetical protein